MYKTIIQIGSHVGNTSNDKLFNTVKYYDNLILVEPVPYLFKLLKKNYNDKFGTNINRIFINKAVSNFIGEIEMTIPSEKNNWNEYPSWASQLASIDKNHISNLFFPGFLVEKINVETTTINEIIREYNIKQIDLLDIDTEGHDYTILMGYNFEIKPHKIRFEHSHMDGFLQVGIRYQELTNKLLSLGYAKTEVDDENTTFELLDVA